MKYVMVVLDGALDEPIPELGDRTPLIVGTGEHLTALRRKSRVGVVQTLPPDWTGDPEAALFGLFGYAPQLFTGRGPLEAAAMQVDLDRTDIAFSLQLVHTDSKRLLDPTAGQFSAASGAALARFVQETLRPDGIQIFPGTAYRHVLVWRDGPDGIACNSPYGVSGVLSEGFPTGDRAERMIRLMWDSMEILVDHPINRRRRDEGKPTADMIWPWAPGRAPELPGFGVRHGIGGGCVAGRELVRGLARLTGLRVPVVPGATGTLDTDYHAKARAALEVLGDTNFVLVHLESPNAAGLAGDWEAKLDAIRRIDQRFFGTLLDRIGLMDDFRILVTVDHATPVKSQRQQAGWMPFMIAGNQEKIQTHGILPFDERAIDEAEWRIDRPWELLTELFR